MRFYYIPIPGGGREGGNEFSLRSYCNRSVLTLYSDWGGGREGRGNAYCSSTKIRLRCFVAFLSEEEDRRGNKFLLRYDCMQVVFLLYSDWRRRKGWETELLLHAYCIHISLNNVVVFGENRGDQEANSAIMTTTGGGGY